MSLTLALVAHDQKKADMAEWVIRNHEVLRRHKIVSTATTGRIVAEACTDVTILAVKKRTLGRRPADRRAHRRRKNLGAVLFHRRALADAA
jgi:methylglyoxal synthase